MQGQQNGVNGVNGDANGSNKDRQKSIRWARVVYAHFEAFNKKNQNMENSDEEKKEGGGPEQERYGEGEPCKSVYVLERWIIFSMSMLDIFFKRKLAIKLGETSCLWLWPSQKCNVR